jgi:ATP-dependent phosphoenolpyruvate carboxykinase
LENNNINNNNHNSYNICILGSLFPKEVAGVESKMLQPENTWVDKEKYHETIKHLERLFEKIMKNMKKIILIIINIVLV